MLLAVLRVMMYLGNLENTHSEARVTLGCASRDFHTVVSCSSSFPLASQLSPCQWFTSHGIFSKGRGGVGGVESRGLQDI